MVEQPYRVASERPSSLSVLLAVQRPPLHRCMVEPCRVASERPSSLSGLLAVRRPPLGACLVVLDVGVRLSAARSPQICVMSGQIPATAVVQYSFSSTVRRGLHCQLPATLFVQCVSYPRQCLYSQPLAVVGMYIRVYVFPALCGEREKEKQ